MSVGKERGNTFNSFYKHLKNILFGHFTFLQVFVYKIPPRQSARGYRLAKLQKSGKVEKMKKNYIFFKLVPIIANLFTYCEILFLIKK